MGKEKVDVALQVAGCRLQGRVQASCYKLQPVTCNFVKPLTQTHQLVSGVRASCSEYERLFEEMGYLLHDS